MFKTISIGLLALSLCACDPHAWERDRAERETAQCLELGFQQNTEAFANCRLQIRTSRNIAGAAGASAATQNFKNIHDSMQLKY